MKKPLLSELTLREKIGQTCIFCVGILDQIENPVEYFSNNCIGASWVLSNPREIYRYTEKALGRNELVGRRDELNLNFVNLINKHMRIPVLPVMDAVQGIPETKFEDHASLPVATSLGATKSTELSFRYGKALADDLHSIGFRWIWSPVADNGGKYSGTRTLSTDRELNAEMLAAFVKGCKEAGVATGVKHFPGKDPYEYRDSHFCSASYSDTFEEWEKTQKIEFQACIDAGTESIMVGHKTFRDYDNTEVNGVCIPCTLSYKVITELIKGDMGFEGVVLTDDVTMKALTAIYPTEKLYVELLRAGNDMILGPLRLDYIDIIEKAVLSGDLPESRIDDACQRVLDLKEKVGLFESDAPIPHPTEERRKEIADNIHKLTAEIAESGISLCTDRGHNLPLNKDKIKKVKIFYFGYSDRCYDALDYAIEEFKRHGAECEKKFGYEPSDTATLDDYDLIVYASYLGFHSPPGGQNFYGKECVQLRYLEPRNNTIAVSFGSPLIYFNYFTATPTFINCYCFSQEIVEGFVKGLYGELQFTDYHPFPLNPIRMSNDVFE